MNAKWPGHDEDMTQYISAMTMGTHGITERKNIALSPGLITDQFCSNMSMYMNINIMIVMLPQG